LIYALVGVILIWRRTRFARALAAVALGHLLFFVAPIAHMQYRYTLPVAYTLAFFAACALARQFDSGSLRKATAVTVCIGALGWMAFRGFDLSFQMMCDARYAASRWLEREFRPGDTAIYFGDSSQLPLLPPGLTPIHAPDASGPEFIERERARFVFVIQDWSSAAGMERSHYLSEDLYERLRNGSLGYRQVKLFETRPLWQRFHSGHHQYIVNPTVRVFMTE
jgi:hypothetical protein